MKRIKFFSVLLILTTSVLLTNCSKGDEPTFDYPMEILYGTWDGTEIYVDSKWIDITKFPYTQFKFSARFNQDMTYSGSGYFGNGSGTYSAVGKIIITYVEGKEYARYVVKSLTNDKAELTMQVGTSDLDVRVKKR